MSHSIIINRSENWVDIETKSSMTFENGKIYTIIIENSGRFFVSKNSEMPNSLEDGAPISNERFAYSHISGDKIYLKAENQFIKFYII